MVAPLAIVKVPAEGFKLRNIAATMQKEVQLCCSVFRTIFSEVESMQVSLPTDLADFVERQIRQGSFESPTAVICEGLGLLRERERQLADLRARLEEGAEQIRRGEGIPAENVFAELRARNKMLQDSADRKTA